MSSIPPPFDRLKQVSSVASLCPTAAPVRLESYSNDVWRIEDARLGSIVLRVAWRGDINRLEREAAIGRELPPNVRYPEVLGYGKTSTGDFPLAYSVTRRLTGQALADGWGSLAAKQRRSAIAQLAQMLRELHRWRPPSELADLVVRREKPPVVGINELLGSDLNPLPIARTVALARHAMTMPYVDPGLITQAIEMLEDLGDVEPVLDDPTQHGLIHGDLHLFNLWRTPSGDVILLDLEWARFAPPLLDIQRLCENADVDMRNGSDTHPTILRWLWQEYPELFQGDRAAQRLRLYSLAFSIRQIIVDPPNAPIGELSPDHSLNCIRRLVAGEWPVPGSVPDLQP
jgi:hypothetical protein